MDIVLVAGLWLDGSAWQEVVPELERRGHRAVPLTLPGQGDGTPADEVTWEDHVASVVAAVDAAAGPVAVVGHSAASALAWVAADARPDRVASVVLIGGVPVADGSTYADFFAPSDGKVPFPGWEQFEGPDSDDLDEEVRQALVDAMVPVPQGVTQGVVRLHDDRRYDVPVVLVCPEFSPEEARGWIDSDVVELQRATNLRLVDLDSGHWPMASAPVELAALIAEAADRRAPDRAGVPGSAR